MERWRIIGADAASGDERSIEVNARDERGAREAARMLGMLVAHVEQLPPPQGPVLAYRTPGLTNRPASVAVARTDEGAEEAQGAVRHAGILAGAAAAVRVAKVLYGLGVVALMLAFAGLAAAALIAISPPERAHVPIVLVMAIVAGAGGMMMIAAAAGLQLLASIGLAVRDIANDTTL